MDAAPLVEAVHAGWAFIMDDKVPLYMTKPDSASTQDRLPFSKDDINMVHPVSGEEEDYRSYLVIRNLHDPSALLDPDMEAAIRTKGVYIGCAHIENSDLPLYMMPQEDNGAQEVAAENGDGDKTPGLIPDKQDEDLLSLESDATHYPGIQEASFDSFEEQILEALGGSEMLTIREAYLEASELHATSIGPLPTEDISLSGRIGRAANYCGAVLKSFRRQMLRGIDHGMVLTMLLHLRIVVNVLRQVFPARRRISEGTTAPPSTKDMKDKKEGVRAQSDSEVVNDRAPHVVSRDKTHEQIKRASQTPRVELDAAFDGALSLNDNMEQQVLSGEDVKATMKTGIPDNGSDEWSWEDIAEADDFAEVIGWEML